MQAKKNPFPKDFGKQEEAQASAVKRIVVSAQVLHKDHLL